MIGRHIFLTLLLTSHLLTACSEKSSNAVEQSSPGWQLIWSDEFNQNGLPAGDRWTFNVGGDGWGNNELQYYTAGDPDNARVEAGKLIIEARKEAFAGNQYTSARLVSKGRGDWTYGRFEIRAKLPSGRGTWPAIWMLYTVGRDGNGGWPDNGEIDIMEHVGFDPGVIHASIHTQAFNFRNNNQKTATLNVPDAETEFHTYALEWSEQAIEVFVDDAKYFTCLNDGSGWQRWPFDKDFYLILNIAVGGDWGGAQGVDDSIFPTRMEVDYVRVFEWRQ